MKNTKSSNINRKLYMKTCIYSSEYARTETCKFMQAELIVEAFVDYSSIDAWTLVFVLDFGWRLKLNVQSDCLLRYLACF